MIRMLAGTDFDNNGSRLYDSINLSSTVITTGDHPNFSKYGKLSLTLCISAELTCGNVGEIISTFFNEKYPMTL